MATRQIVVTRPVRTLDKYKTEKKSSCFGFSSKGLQETCEVNTSSSSHRTINTSIKKRQQQHTQPVFLGCIAPHLPPPLLLVNVASHMGLHSERRGAGVAYQLQL
jgi:hypothetical protein